MRRCLFLFLLLQSLHIQSMHVPPLNWLPCAPDFAFVSVTDKKHHMRGIGRDEPTVGCLGKRLLDAWSAVWGGKAAFLVAMLPGYSGDDAKVLLTPQERERMRYYIDGAIAELAANIAAARQDDPECPLHEQLRDWYFFDASARLAHSLQQEQFELRRLERILNFAQAQQIEVALEKVRLAQRAKRDVACDHASYQAVAWALEQITDVRMATTTDVLHVLKKQNECS